MEQSTQLQSFNDDKSYKQALIMAEKISESEIIPETYRKKPANIIIALDMANRSGVSVMTIMQNMYIVKGKPSFSGAYVIAGINSCGIYDRLRYKITGKGDTLSCFAYATDKETGIIDEGPTVTIEMAKAEGWLSNPKWKNMPELMIRYRAAAFFGRVYCPQIMMGMHMTDEIEDISPSRYTDVINEAKEKADKEFTRAMLLLEDCESMSDLIAMVKSIDVESFSAEQAQLFTEKGKSIQERLKTT